MPDAGEASAEPAFFAGPALVAKWLGVTRAALSNWLRRYDDYPPPAAVISGPLRDSLAWRHDQRADWIRWAHTKDVTVMTPLEEAGNGNPVDPERKDEGHGADCEQAVQLGVDP